MPNERVKRMHFVPRAYLRGFADEDGRLMTIDLETGKRFVQNVETAAAINGYYEVLGPDGVITDRIERDLSNPEGLGINAIRTILSVGIDALTEGERYDLAWYIAFQQTRVPAQRSSVNQVADLISKLQIAAGGRDAIREHLRSRGSEPDEEEVEGLWATASDFDTYNVSADQNTHVLLALQLATSLAPILAATPWALKVFERKTLITSDRPIGYNQLPKNRDPFRGVGFGTADVIWFPLSRSAALLISPHIADGQVLAPTARAANEINLLVAFFADRWLYHHPDDDPLRGLEVKRPDKGMQVSGVTPAELASIHDKQQSVDLAPRTGRRSFT